MNQAILDIRDQVGEPLAATAEGQDCCSTSSTTSTRAFRNLLPSKLELLWDWALEQPQKVLLKVLAVAVAHTVNAVQSPHDDASTGRLAAGDALARALTFFERRGR